LKRDNLPRAIEEMHEIVRTTEDASNATMESTEAITNAIPEIVPKHFRILRISGSDRTANQKGNVDTAVD